jgi:hypothetical protein
MKYIDKNPDDIVGVVGQKMKEEWDASANPEAFELECGGGQVKVTSRGIMTGAHDKECNAPSSGRGKVAIHRTCP